MSNTQSHFYWVDNSVSIMHASSPAVTRSPHALQQLRPQLGSIHSGSLRPQVLFPKKLCWYESIVQYRTALYRIVPVSVCHQLVHHPVQQGQFATGSNQLLQRLAAPWCRSVLLLLLCTFRQAARAQLNISQIMTRHVRYRAL